MLATVIITAHNEGGLLKTAFDSVVRGFESAVFSLSMNLRKDRRLQVLFVLDRADANTEQTVSDIQEATRSERRFSVIESIDVIRTSYGEPGSARNDGVLAARGDVVIVMDGDDLVGRSFVTQGILAILDNRNSAARNGIVCHPEYLYYFGERAVIWKQPHWHEYLTNYASLLHTNLWDVTMIAARSLLADNPYLPSSLSAGSGYEDWEWCLYTAGRGIEHRVVPKTIAYKRAKPYGRFTRDSRGDVLIDTSRTRSAIHLVR
jgi:glycosyltransferase involved in cell wall biosynthesis